MTNRKERRASHENITMETLIDIFNDRNKSLHDLRTIIYGLPNPKLNAILEESKKLFQQEKINLDLHAIIVDLATQKLFLPTSTIHQENNRQFRKSNLTIKQLML